MRTDNRCGRGIFKYNGKNVRCGHELRTRELSKCTWFETCPQTLDHWRTLIWPIMSPSSAWTILHHIFSGWAVCPGKLPFSQSRAICWTGRNGSLPKNLYGWFGRFGIPWSWLFAGSVLNVPCFFFLSHLIPFNLYFLKSISWVPKCMSFWNWAKEVDRLVFLKSRESKQWEKLHDKVHER